MPGNTENAVAEDRNPGCADRGGGTFCAGMDLKGFLARTSTPAGRGFAGIVQRRPAKPVIAAVEGYALWSSDSRNRGKEVEAQRF